MAKGISPEFKILGIIAFLLAIVSLLLVMSLQPVHPKILAVWMKYIWLFIGGSILLTVIISRIIDNAFSKDKGIKK